jgi:hypothetical protein
MRFARLARALRGVRVIRLLRYIGSLRTIVKRGTETWELAKKNGDLLGLNHENMRISGDLSIGI